jgi:flagellar L-ring protein precursor FlgH
MSQKLPSAAVTIALSALTLSGCGTVGRLSAIGKPPRISAAIARPAPDVQPSLGGQAIAGRYTGGVPAQQTAGGASLFRTGAGAFFHDQRASSVGDILTVRINIADNAVLDNSSTRSRRGKENLGLPGLLGLESKIGKVLPGNPDPAGLVATDSSSASGGTGNTSRSEQINTAIAAVVVAVLPNGNLSIEGHQEVRVNFELREVVVRGIVRPQDIARDNSIRSNQIAEARIGYGGRGQLTDMQQPRLGQQLLDVILPF